MCAKVVGERHYPGQYSCVCVRRTNTTLYMHTERYLHLCNIEGKISALTLSNAIETLSSSAASSNPVVSEYACEKGASFLPDPAGNQCNLHLPNPMSAFIIDGPQLLVKPHSSVACFHADIRNRQCDWDETHSSRPDLPAREILSILCPTT